MMNAKKWILLFFTLALAAGMAAAQEDEGAGFSLGAEVGFGDVTDEVVLGVTPNIAYENSFGNLDIAASLGYTFTFDDDLGQELGFEFEGGYNFSLSESGVLSLIVYDENTFYVDPEPDDNNYHTGMFKPSLKYTQTLGFGDLYGQLGFPIDYLTGVKDADANVSTELTLGLAPTDDADGFGLELTGTYLLSPDAEYTSTGLLVSYKKSVFYGEVEVVANKDFDVFEINPEIDISVGAWTFTVRGEIVTDSDHTAASPFIGASYSF
jgi:hypothetical protein